MILFIYDQESAQESAKDKLVITLDYRTRSANPKSGKKETLVMNMVNTGMVMNEDQSKSLTAYQLIWRRK